MNVAIYARYSTDRQDKSSIIGQVRNCRAMAEREGHTVTTTRTDQAISGTDDNRPGYQALLQDLTDGIVQGVIVDETSRLTRNQAELHRLLAELAYRDQFVIDTKGFDSRADFAPLLAGIFGAIDSMEVKKIAHRTRRGLRERHGRGLSAGGKAYGYRSEPIDPGNPDFGYRKVIYEPEAPIVRRIFQMYADGLSCKQIASSLNAEGVPSPGSNWKRKTRRKRGWQQSAIYGDFKRGVGILANELYRGRYIWGRTEWRKVPGTSKRRARVKPETEWQVLEIPELRIVSEALWDAVQCRRMANFEKSKAVREALGSSARTGRTPKHLLSGLLKCPDCESHFIVIDRYSYGCSTRAGGGHSACSNDTRLSRTRAEDALIAHIRTALLEHEDAFRRAASDALRNHARDDTSVGPLREAIAEIEAQAARVADAIAKTGLSGALDVKIKELHTEQCRLESKLARAQRKALPGILPNARKVFERLVSQLGRLGTSDEAIRTTARLRTHLAQLLGQLTVERNGSGVPVMRGAITSEGLELLVGPRPPKATLSLVAGARYGNNLRQTVCLLTIPRN